MKTELEKSNGKPISKLPVVRNFRKVIEARDINLMNKEASCFIIQVSKYAWAFICHRLPIEAVSIMLSVLAIVRPPKRLNISRLAQQSFQVSGS